MDPSVYIELLERHSSASAMDYLNLHLVAPLEDDLRKLLSKQLAALPPHVPSDAFDFFTRL